MIRPTRILNRTYVRDRRDDDYVLRAKKTTRKVRRWPVGKVLDQLDEPACVGYAFTGVLLAPEPKLPVNPFGLYKLAQHRDEYEGEDYEGTSVRGGADVLKTLGYLSRYEWARDVDALIYAALEIGPLVAGTEWTADMEKGGLMRPTGKVLGGHAWRIIGINLNTGELEMVNSWGKEWSDGGRARIGIEDFVELMDRDGEVCVPRKQVPKLRAA